MTNHIYIAFCQNDEYNVISSHVGRDETWVLTLGGGVKHNCLKKDAAYQSQQGLSCLNINILMTNIHMIPEQKLGAKGGTLSMPSPQNRPTKIRAAKKIT